MSRIRGATFRNMQCCGQFCNFQKNGENPILNFTPSPPSEGLLEFWKCFFCTRPLNML